MYNYLCNQSNVENLKILSFVLKVSMEGEHLIESGRLFQSFGAMAAKAQSPLTSRLVE